MKRMVSSVLACVLLLITIVGSASAASGDYDYAPLLVNDNGFAQGPITYNGRQYTGYVSITYKSGIGTYMAATCVPPIKISLSNLTVTYWTVKEGNITVSGGENDGTISDDLKSVVGGYVKYSGGMQNVLELVHASGSAVFFGDQIKIISVAANNLT